MEIGMTGRSYIADFLLKNYGFSSLSEKIFLGGGAKEREAVKLGCALQSLLNKGFPPWVLVRFLFPIIRHSLQMPSGFLSPRAATHPSPQEFCHLSEVLPLPGAAGAVAREPFSEQMLVGPQGFGRALCQ